MLGLEGAREQEAYRYSSHVSKPALLFKTLLFTTAGLPLACVWLLLWIRTYGDYIPKLETIATCVK